MAFRVWNRTKTYLKPTYQHTYLPTYLICDNSESSESSDSGDSNDSKTQFATKLRKWNWEQQQNLNKNCVKTSMWQFFGITFFLQHKIFDKFFLHISYFYNFLGTTMFGIKKLWQKIMRQYFFVKKIYKKSVTKKSWEKMWH